MSVGCRTARGMDLAAPFFEQAEISVSTAFAVVCFWFLSVFNGAPHSNSTTATEFHYFSLSALRHIFEPVYYSQSPYSSAFVFSSAFLGRILVWSSCLVCKFLKQLSLSLILLRRIHRHKRSQARGGNLRDSVAFSLFFSAHLHAASLRYTNLFFSVLPVTTSVE